MSGWIKLHRQIVTSSKFADPDILRLWILCLTKAAHKETVAVIDRQEIPLLPGQFVTGRFSLHEDYNSVLAPRKKIKDTTLWNWLQRLEKWGDLDIKSTNKYSVVTVLKWTEYQGTLTTEPQQIDNRLTTEPQQFDTNKKLKKKEELKHIVASDECDSSFESFWKVYPKKDGKAPCFKKWQSYWKAKKLNPDEVMAGFQRYKSFVEHERNVRKFDRAWLSPLTFLNQRQWESEWEISNVAIFKPKDSEAPVRKYEDMVAEEKKRSQELVEEMRSLF